jgi:hypothetical protein
MSEAYSQAARWLAIPVARLDNDFFRLRTGVAGEITRKFVQYGVKVVFVGDVSQHIENSYTFCGFVREAKRGSHFWFVDSFEDLFHRLEPAQSRAGTPQTQQ